MAFQKGHVPFNKGKSRSSITIEKIRIANIGKHLSEKTKQKISKKLKGIVRSSETRLRMSERQKGEQGYWYGKKLSEKTRRRMSLSHPKGDKHHNWKGGISPLNKQIRASVEYRLWREAVFARDGWRCQNCGCISQKGFLVYLHPHHIKYFSKYPDLRFAIDNGITLCKLCHRKVHTENSK